MGTAEQPKRETLLRKLVRLLDYCISLAGAILVFVALFQHPLLVVLSGLVIPMVIGASTLIHEAGHVAGAIVSGWRVVVMTVWPVAWHGPTNSITISSAVSHQDGGGYVFAAPASRAAATRLRHIAVCLGGPIASLIMVVLCYAWIQPPPPGETGYASGFSIAGVSLERTWLLLILAFGLFNLRAFIVTIIPGRYKDGSASDGLQTLDTLTGKQVINGNWSGWIATLLRYNTRLRDIPAWMYEAARAEDAHDETAASLHDSWDIARALDARDVDARQARALIETYRTAHGDNDWLHTIDAWQAAIYEHDLPRAHAALAALKGQSNSHELLAATRAAVAAREGDPIAVANQLDRMELALLKQSPFPNATFQDIRRQIEATLASASTPAA